MKTSCTNNENMVTEKKGKLSGLSIHLVEDEYINRRMMSSYLEAMGAQVIISKNGQELLDSLREQQGDMILMDIRMPVMDGMEATRIIREQETVTGDHIPIIAITAQATTGYRDECLAVGMDAYISKPVTLTELTSKILKLQQAA